VTSPLPPALAAELAEALADLIVRAIQAETQGGEYRLPSSADRDTIAATSTIPRRQQ